MKIKLTARIFFAAICLNASQAEPVAKEENGKPATNPATDVSDLYTREGADPSFQSLVDDGVLKPGNRFAKIKVPGSKIDVNNDLVEKNLDKITPIPKKIGLHTQNASGIRRNEFGNWSRWYQEDGNTQVFRLFEGEQSARHGVGEDSKPGRVEIYTSMQLAKGEWAEWEGTYMLVEPVGAAIFQLFHEGHLWAFHINSSPDGSMALNLRRPGKGVEKRTVFVKNAIGKNVTIKARSNGTDFEVYKKVEGESDDFELLHKGKYQAAEDSKIAFRWGIYCGSKKGESVPKDALMFVTSPRFQKIEAGE